MKIISYICTSLINNRRENMILDIDMLRGFYASYASKVERAKSCKSLRVCLAEVASL